MKFTLGWLKDYIDLTASTQDVIEKLTALGLEVEEVDDKAALYAPFKVAKVKSAEQHPNADRLRVCQVETEDGMVQVVCGAPNARAGMTGVFAPSGSYIPGLDTTLQKGVIRGEESNGMLVSEKEMCLSDNHDGIIDLDDSHSIGTPITDLFDGLDDVTIEIGLTPNRADCAGIYGIARDLAAAGLGTLKPLDTQTVPVTFDSKVNVTTETPETCPNFLGREIRGVKNGESPAWLKARLEAIGLRPISALVDITNYFCVGLNRPLHVYDTDRLQGDIVVKLAQGGESFDALNDKSYTLTGGETMITDDSGLIGLGGIVGGTSTGCESDTVNVFLECAFFDAAHIARVGRKHQILSDARYRFERGVDPVFLPQAVELATQMILDLCGGEVGSVVTAGQAVAWERDYPFDFERTKSLTGVDVPKDEQIQILESLGFAIDGNQVTPPSWRGDIMGSADLVEEVVRIVGYDAIPALPVKKDGTLTENALSPYHDLRMKSGRALAARGLQECVTWSFMNHDLMAHFMGKHPDPALRLTNPISVEIDTMRPTMIANLIQAAARNDDRGHGDAGLFETGPIFHGVNPGDQSLCAAGIRHGSMGEKHWSSSDHHRGVDAFDAKADALAVLAAINPSLKPQITRDAPDYYHPGRSGAFRLGKNVLVYFGEIHPAILEEIDITGPVVGFEVFVENVPQAKSKSAARAPLSLSAFQPVYRDFAFLVANDVAAETVIGAARKGAGDMVEQVQIFDVYTGKGVPEGQKSLAVSVQWQPTDKTMTDKDIEALSQSVVDQVTSKTGASLRG